MNDQNNLQVQSSYKALRDQNNLLVNLQSNKVAIIAPTAGQTDFPVGGNYQWTKLLNYDYYQVQTASSDTFDPLIEDTIVKAQQLASTLSANTGYWIRVKAKQIVTTQDPTPDPEITSVSISPSTATVTEGSTLTLSGSVQGTGAYNSSGTWSRTNGTVPFTVSGNDITFSPADGSAGAQSEFVFTADGDNSFTASRTITVTEVTATPTVDDSLEGDLQALNDIYDVTDGANWTNNTGWPIPDTASMGDAFGVTVWESGEHDGRVKDLFLLDNGLNNAQRVGGELDLDSRGRYQLIPNMSLKESIGNLKQAEYIDLRKNTITGNIPSSFWFLSNLKVAALGHNNSGSLRTQPSLYSSKVPYEGAQFTGSIPSAVSNMTSLVALYLQRNYFDQTPIPVELFQLPNIEVIDIAHNGHTGPLPNVELPPKINYINVMGGSFDTRRNQIFEQTGPHYYLSGNLPPLWGSSNTLVSLLFQRNDFTGSIPPEWAGMTNLFLVLWDMNYEVGGDFPNWLDCTNCPELDTVTIERMNLSGGMAQDYNPKELGVLAIGHTNNITGANNGEIPDAFKSINHPNYPYRIILWGMEDQSFEGPFMDDMSGLNNLRAVSIRGNSFSGPLPVDYPSSDELDQLDLSQNLFSGPIPSTIGNMTTVINVRLNGNNLSSYETGGISPVVLSGGNYVSGMNKLKSFRVDGNELAQSDLDQIILDLWANVQSRLGTQFENWGTTANLNISGQSPIASPSTTQQVTDAINGLEANGWTITRD